MSKRYHIDSEELIRLKTEVESMAGRRPTTPSDFVFLSDKIRGDGCGYISPTTLKRVWGYINDTDAFYSPGHYTLRILCNYVGYVDMDDFAESDTTVQSREYTGNFVESSTLPTDCEVTIRWSPNRRCVLRHVKSSLFEVVEVENARLRTGDIVECGCFTQNAPAYFSRVFRKDAAPMTYIAGSANGIRFSVLGPDFAEE